jgi:hypothetical protein
MTTTKDDADRTTEVWVYAGERRGTGGKTVYAWYDIDEDNTRYFKGNLVTAAGVGGMYEVVTSTREGGGITAHGEPKYIRMWDDEDRIQGWHAEHRGWQAARAIERQRANDKKDAPQIFDMTLKEIRAKIMSTNYSTAEGIMGAVVAYLGQGIR